MESRKIQAANPQKKQKKEKNGLYPVPGKRCRTVRGGREKTRQDDPGLLPHPHDEVEPASRSCFQPYSLKPFLDFFHFSV